MTWAFPGLEPNKYRALLIDCPWTFNAGTKGRPQHYPRMTDVELAALPIWELAHPDGCHVFVWITSPMLVRALDIVKRWSPPDAKVKECIRYSGRAFVWLKLHRRLNAKQISFFLHKDSVFKGQGFTTRKSAEDVLIFKYGKPKRLRRDIGEVIISPLREHSRKPDEIYELIEQFCPGPYAELFSRENRKNWESWGNESGKFNQAA